MTRTTSGITLIALAVTFTACVSKTEVVPMGPNKYMVSATSHGTFGGAGDEGVEAVKLANAYCEKMGKRALVRDMDKHGSGLQAGVGLEISASVVFSCLSESDPEYKQQ